MTIKLNGKPESIDDGLSVNCLVESLAVKKEGLVVLVNGDVLPGEKWNASLKENDGIELLQFVSGG